MIYVLIAAVAFIVGTIAGALFQAYVVPQIHRFLDEDDNQLSDHHHI